MRGLRPRADLAARRARRRRLDVGVAAGRLRQQPGDDLLGVVALLEVAHRARHALEDHDRQVLGAQLQGQHRRRHGRHGEVLAGHRQRGVHHQDELLLGVLAALDDPVVVLGEALAGEVLERGLDLELAVEGLVHDLEHGPGGAPQRADQAPGAAQHRRRGDAPRVGLELAVAQHETRVAQPRGHRPAVYGARIDAQPAGQQQVGFGVGEGSGAQRRGGAAERAPAATTIAGRRSPAAAVRLFFGPRR